MINPRSSFAPVGSSEFQSPLKPRLTSQVRRSLTGSFSGPISDDELKQSFMAMRSSTLNQSGHTAGAGSPAAAHNPKQDDEQAGVGIYFVKNERTGCFYVEHILPGYAAEKCGSILPGDIVTHVGALKLPPQLSLEQLRPLIVLPSPPPPAASPALTLCLTLLWQVGRAGTAVSLTFQRGSETDESYGFYQVSLTRGHLNADRAAHAPVPSAAATLGFQAVSPSSGNGRQRAVTEKGFNQVRGLEHRAMVSLDHASPLPPPSTSSATARNGSVSAAQAAAAAPVSSEAAALVDILQRLLRDSQLRSQQAGFSTILRDLDACIINRPDNII